MSRGLSRQELNQALEKIRSRYRDLAAQYRMPSLFNVERFNGRYLETLRLGLPLDRFLADEVGILKELEERAIEKSTPPDRSASRMAEALLESFQAAVSGYPLFAFSSGADEESARLAGMLQQLDRDFGHAVPALRSLQPGSRAKAILEEAEPRIFQMLGSDRNGFSRFLTDIQLRLARPGVNPERIKKEFFKEAGFLLFQLSELFRAMLDEDQCRDSAVCNEALERVEAARRDFRLTAFVPGAIG